MKTYELSPEIKRVAALIHERQQGIPDEERYDIASWLRVNMLGWPIDAMTRVVLEAPEVMWALDLAASGDWDG